MNFSTRRGRDVVTITMRLCHREMAAAGRGFTRLLSMVTADAMVEQLSADELYAVRSIMALVTKK